MDEKSSKLSVVCCAGSKDKLDRLERWLAGSNTDVSRTLSSYELLYSVSKTSPSLIIMSSEAHDLPVDRIVHEILDMTLHTHIVLLVAPSRLEQFNFLSTTTSRLSVIVEDPQGQFVGRILGIIRKQHDWQTDIRPLNTDIIRGILEILPEAVMVLDDNLQIRLTNQKLVELFDATQPNLIGTSLMDLICDSIHDEVSKQLKTSFQRGIATDATDKIELLLKNSVGDVLPCRGNYHIANIKQLDLLILTLRDESTEISNEADRTFQERFEKLVMDLSTDILGGSVRKLPVIMLSGLKKLSIYLDYHCIQVIAISSYLSTFQQFLCWPQKKLSPSDFDPLWLKKEVFGQGALNIADTQSLPLDAMEEFDWLRGLRMNSFIAVPVNAEDKSAGMLIACRKRSSSWDAADISRLQSIAKLISSMLLRLGELKNFRKTEKELVNVNKRLTHLARKDALTGLSNRRQFDQTLSREIRRAARQRSALSLIMGDIDYFKPYNDELGHVAGDKCLKGIGTTIDAVFQRAGDLTARYGGEEFAVILPGSDREAVIKEASRLQQAIEELNIAHPKSKVSSRVSISLGLATIENSLIDMSEFIKNADTALYAAKKSGRNTTVHFDDIDVSVKASDNGK